MNHKSARILKHAAIHGILIILTAILIFPLIWMALGAFKTQMEATMMPPRLFPSHFNLDNFFEIEKYFPLQRFLFNSVFVAICGVFLQALFSAMAAFVFAKISFRFREALFTCFLVTMMIPAQLTYVTLFKLFAQMNISNTYMGLILPTTFSVLSIFLLRQHIRSLPDALMEAALMDGAPYSRIFFNIILPLCKPALATVIVLAFMGSWNNYLWPLIITNDINLATLPLGLAQLQGEYNTAWNLLMMGNLISFVPMLIVYALAQKYFIQSIAMSGIKG